jgi:hypothetical protein
MGWASRRGKHYGPASRRWHLSSNYSQPSRDNLSTLTAAAVRKGGGGRDWRRKAAAFAVSPPPAHSGGADGGRKGKVEHQSPAQLLSFPLYRRCISGGGIPCLAAVSCSTDSLVVVVGFSVLGGAGGFPDCFVSPLPSWFELGLASLRRPPPLELFNLDG